MQYLVEGTGGPGFASPEEAVEILQNTVLPSFDALMKLEKDKKILAGGLPVADRAVVCIVEASSHEEVDRLVRQLPLWGALEWSVIPLQSFAGRAAQERETVAALTKGK